MSIRKSVKVKYIDDEQGLDFTFEPVDGSLTVKKVKGGYEARYLVQDDDPQAPDEWDNDNLFLVAYHRDFTVESKLIDKQQAQNLYRPDDQLDIWEKDFVDAWKEKYHIFGLEAYIHGGVSLALSGKGDFPDRRWDVSQLGLVFVLKETWPDEDKARDAAKSLIDEWNMYLSGDVWGCVVERYDKNKQQIDQDSCWGFYGFGYALEELKDFNG